MTVPFRQSEAIERVGSLYRDDLVRLEEIARTESNSVRTSWEARFLDGVEFRAEDVDRLVSESERRGLAAADLVTLKLHMIESPIVIFDSSHWYTGFVSLSLANAHAEWEKSETLDEAVRGVIEYVRTNAGEYRVSFHTRQWAQSHDKAVADSLKDWMRGMGKEPMRRPNIGSDDPPRSKPQDAPVRSDVSMLSSKDVALAQAGIEPVPLHPLTGTYPPSPQSMSLAFEDRKSWPKRAGRFIGRHFLAFTFAVLASVVAGLVLYYGLGIGKPS